MKPLDPSPRENKRSARATLSRGAIVESALALALDEGLEAVTMRAIAGVLNVGAMSLYRHFQGREELIDALLDELLGTISPAGDVGPLHTTWQEQIRAIALAHRALLHRVPSAIPYFLAKRTTGPHAARFGETILRVLKDAGFADDVAVNGFFMVLALNYGFVGFERRRLDQDASPHDDDEHARRAQLNLALLPLRDYPLTVALAGPLAHFATTDREYEFALDVMLTGLAAQHYPA